MFFKIRPETFKRYDPVEIEIKTIPVLDYNVTYRRGVNNDTEFYIEKGPRISVLFLHGPGKKTVIRVRLRDGHLDRIPNKQYRGRHFRKYDILFPQRNYKDNDHWECTPHFTL